ncbi:LytTR family DNA-binding domain-containing protein [Sphingobacterium sp. SRCM116780]|uniref:LytR/AlgR family response regulator transcription factor n=1 Tax=Sphingobacterium sp. SRCM116780 TaxID=2907623 RepID=UPI001F424A44|nr:LytTR family DNA-binding domain-containing protein [Sphingobacterium sp. SRCM116780]UIR55796.1 LytTR family DNA-binding domain-containing protein [Sphingobacterium sp. SRCM116780]
MNIIIIEDELPSARLLKRKIEKMGYAVQTILHAVADAKEWFATHAHPDLILLDIQLSDGLSFEIFENQKIKSSLIFTTAYDEFVLKAFKLNSIDYLLKPIIDEELVFAFDKFLQHEQSKSVIDLDNIKALLTTKNQGYKERFTIKIGQSIKIIETSSITCFYSENKGTYCRTSDQHDYLLDFTMEQLENLLDPQQFFRINRSHIIHINHIKDIAIHSNSRLRIYLHHDRSDDMIVSREKVTDFKNWLDQ